MKTNLVAAGNVVPPIYYLLKEKGFEIRKEEIGWIAENENQQFIAENIIELAGLIYLVENKGNNWKVDDDLIHHFIEKFT